MTPVRRAAAMALLLLGGLVAGCTGDGSGGPDSPDSEDRPRVQADGRWRLEPGEHGVRAGLRITIEDGQVDGDGPCGGFGGSWSETEGIEKTRVSLVGCDPATSQKEDVYYDLLDGDPSRDGDLLRFTSEAGTLVFRRIPEPGTSTSAAPSPSPAPSAAPTTEAAPAPYQPAAGEVDGPAKRVAARAVEALPRVERVTYTQYFGYAPPAASILVEADFARGGGATYDVRLSRAADRWRVATVERAAPQRLRTPSALARRVLDDRRITLPWDGRKDVASGRVADSVLRSMLALAEEHRFTVSVLISAHPVNVFGTDRRSNHPDGLAYDIGSIDGRLVVDASARSLVTRVMREAAATGAYQVGGPVDLDGGDRQYFSDPTHSDHVHVGFTS